MHNRALEQRAGIKFFTAHTVSSVTRSSSQYHEPTKIALHPRKMRLLYRHAITECFTIVRKGSKLSKANEIRKVWPTCAHEREFKDSGEYLTEKARKCKRILRASKCTFSSTIQRIALSGD